MEEKVRVPRHHRMPKKDPTPSWEGFETWTRDEFHVKFRAAMEYYRLEKTIKDLKPKILEWMDAKGYDKRVIQQFKKTKDSRCGSTMGAIAACLLRGMPEQCDAFNQGKNTAEWLDKEIHKVIAEGADDVVVDVDVKKVEAKPVIVQSIQDRVREQAGQIAEEIDVAIDNFVGNPDAFNPKEFKMINMLRGKGCKAAHARYIKGFYENSYNDLVELSSGNADPQLREAYSHLPRKNVRKLIEFHELVRTACDQLAAEAKVLKKPRAKRVKPVEELVKNLKFRVSEDKLGIASVPPSQIVGAQALVVYNTKTRKIGYYISKTSTGLGVKGTTITEYTEKSNQKTLRKPVDQLKEFKEQNTLRKFESWYEKSIKTTETSLNGRIGPDIILLKVFK